MVKQINIKIIGTILFIIIALIQVVESFDSLIKLISLILICIISIIFYLVYFNRIKNEYGKYLPILIPIVIVGVISAASYKIYTLNNSHTEEIFNSSLFDTSTSINIDKEQLSDKNYVVTVGKLYYNGNDQINLMPDYSLAFKYLNMAQAMGNINAYLPLAKIYYYGQGVERNLQIAYEYCMRIFSAGYKSYEATTLLEKIIEDDKIVTDKDTIEYIQNIKQNFIYLDYLVLNYNNKDIRINDDDVDKLILLADENYASAAVLLVNYYFFHNNSKETEPKCQFYAEKAYELGIKSSVISLIRSAGKSMDAKAPIDTILQYSNIMKHIWLETSDINKYYSTFDKYRISKSIIENPIEGLEPNDSTIFDSLKMEIKKEILSKKPIL